MKTVETQVPKLDFSPVGEIANGKRATYYVYETRAGARLRQWLERKGLRFLTGPEPETDLTAGQILGQCKMYIAALRIADEFGCDAIGIQYQQGLKDLAPASDLAEGLLNNVDRPPVTSARMRGA